MKTYRILSKLAILFLTFANVGALAESVPLTILHTNDIHSHFRAEKTALGLGGLARLTTAVRELRSSIPNTLLVDGGDWSEGNIYYTDGVGTQALAMMDHIGYDVAIVGNHDWLNGPDLLLDVVTKANPKLSLLAANVDTRRYSRASEFNSHIVPYTIRSVKGVKVAFIGLITYEFMYNQFLKPVGIREPFLITRHLAHDLKKDQGVDAVVVISHNPVETNAAILNFAPDVDLVIGAHDHIKLTKPRIVKRLFGPPAWIVETGRWGQFLGRVDMRITPRAEARAQHRNPVELLDYHLIQLDSTVPEDPETLARLTDMERAIEKQYGPIFEDHVGDSEIDLNRDGLESPIGNLATDAYREATGADIAFDNVGFLYGEMHEGPLTTADVFNVNPGVYNPLTRKTWTVKTLPMSGQLVRWVLDAIYGLPKHFSLESILNFSGLSFMVDHSHRPSPDANLPEWGLSSPQDQYAAKDSGIIRDVRVDQAPLDPRKSYRVAISGGVLTSIEFIDRLLFHAIPIRNLSDTGVEAWRMILDHVKRTSPITSEKIHLGERVRMRAPDLGVLYDGVSWRPTGALPHGHLGQIKVTVKNYGATASAATGNKLAILTNQNGLDYTRDPEYTRLGEIELPSLAPLESKTFIWDDVNVPESRGLISVSVHIETAVPEINPTNDQVTRFFRIR